MTSEFPFLTRRSDLLVVDIGDLKTASEPSAVIVTYSLGSCVGVTLFDPVINFGGMIHCMLPLSKSDPVRAKAKPYSYTDLAMQGLLTVMFEAGARRDRIVARVAGGASMYDDKGMFNIGQKNYTIVRKILWKNSILISGEEIGGTVSRTMYLELETGRTYIRSGQEMYEI